MMGKIRWYKRDPVAWLHGTRMLSREERGDYADVIELIMSHDGKLLDDDQHIARWIGCHWRTWKTTKARLIELGKLSVVDGYLVNKRCSREAQEVLKIVSERVQAGRKGGIKSGEVRRKNNDLDEANDEAKANQLTTNNKQLYKKETSLGREVKKEDPPASPPVAAAKPQPRPSNGNGCRIPDSWKPSNEDVLYAVSQGFSPIEIERITVDFHQYWQAKSGKDATKRSWSLTWQRWTRTEADRKAERIHQLNAKDRVGRQIDERREINNWLAEQAWKGGAVPVALEFDGYPTDAARTNDGQPQDKVVSICGSTRKLF